MNIRHPQIAACHLSPIIWRLNSHNQSASVFFDRDGDAARQIELLAEQAVGRVALDFALGASGPGVVQVMRIGGHGATARRFRAGCSEMRSAASAGPRRRAGGPETRLTLHLTVR
jgi:hypothetical protein